MEVEPEVSTEALVSALSHQGSIAIPAGKAVKRCLAFQGSKITQSRLGKINPKALHIGMISTSEIKIAVTVDEVHIEDAARAVHDAFGLDKEPV